MTRIATMILAVAVVFAIGFGLGCGGGSSGSGVDGTKQVSALDATDKKGVCDWFAAQVGGYGSTTTCSMAQLMAPVDQADCLSSFPVCAVTVATFESCVSKILTAQKTCTDPAITDARNSTDCQAVNTAACFN
jgi:hypothetical protein